MVSIFEGRASGGLFGTSENLFCDSDGRTGACLTLSKLCSSLKCPLLVRVCADTLIKNFKAQYSAEEKPVEGRRDGEVIAALKARIRELEARLAELESRTAVFEEEMATKLEATNATIKSAQHADEDTTESIQAVFGFMRVSEAVALEVRPYRSFSVLLYSDCFTVSTHRYSDDRSQAIR